MARSSGGSAGDGPDSYVEVGGHRLRLTNLDKVLYPETGTTKAEVIEYYSRVADALITHARDRPATRKRWVSGVGTAEKPGQVFFEKNLPSSAPDWILRRPIQHSDHVNEYPLVNDLATLVWIAQQAALEIHVPQWRFGRNGARKNPDRMVLDLDPGEGAGLAECAEVARLVRQILQGMGLDPMPVTSGSKGIHLYAALDGTQSSDEVSAVAHELARALEADHPELVVSDMKKAVRGGKVLLDWSQNNGSKTTVVPYSLRGRARPTVAAPRTWRELAAPGLAQLEFGEVLKRLAAKGDPLADVSAGRSGDFDSGHERGGEELAEYRRMRNRSKTPEPFGDVPGSDPSWKPDPQNPHFVIQEHHASSLHYDFRLERDGVLVSWAVPKGVPTDPSQNHLAVHVEDHPFDYGTFEGSIPKGEYGAGEVAIWDRGRYELEKWRDDPGDGEVILTIHGEKHGSHRLALIQTKQGDNPKNWMLHLMKSQDPVDWDAEGGPVNRVTGEKWHGHRTVSSGRKGLGAPTKTIVGSRVPSTALHPMLATLGATTGVDRFAGGPDWSYEMKWDGIRAIATIRGDEVTLRSRNGLDLTGSYPELAELAAAVRGDAVLDGEIVALDGAGRPSFGTLQKRMGLTSPRDVERGRLATPVHYFVFDVLSAGGISHLDDPYATRRGLLAELVTDRGAVTVPPDAGDDLAAALATSEKLGLEGVIAKRRDSPYRAGKRSRDWIKLKHTLTQEVVVGGWRPGNGSRADSIGSLLLGIPDADGLRYVGRVGTGFTDRQLAEIRARLDGMTRATPPLLDVPSADARDAHWVTPSLVGEVEFAELTADGRLRAPSWRGWRPDKDPSEVVREAPGQ
ncbi:ATP-dependent DNA ligase [Lysinimonas soli]|uniref:DNA ligase (ATP) n=1 Tax=Lysinimonas soli TaxID=1074233 RepID=A0ABW0NL11_9MICO